MALLGAYSDLVRSDWLGARWRMTFIKRSRFIQLACVIAVLSGAGVALWMLWPTPGINPRVFERIQIGMTEAKVCAMLGGPPRNAVGFSWKLHFTRRRNERWAIWRAKDFAVAVYLDQEDRVMDKDCAPPYFIVEPDTFPDKVLLWLGIKQPSRVEMRE